MLTAIIVGDNQKLVQYLRQVCAEFGDICIHKTMGGATRRFDFAATLSAYEPDVAFVDISDLETPESLAAVCLQELLPRRLRTVLVPFAEQPPPDTLLHSSGTVAGPVLTPPFDAEQLDLAVRTALRRKSSKKTSQVVAVLPAKPGDGATTLAINLAGAAVGTYRKKTLYIEADLRSGAICYQLNLQPRFPVGDVLFSGCLIDGWAGAVSSSHGIDILPMGGTAQTFRSSRWDLYRLLWFAREQYEVVVVDLPAPIDEIAESVIAEADRVTMVCTPEPTSLGLVSRRLRDLEAAGTRHGHLQLLVNRYGAGDPVPQELARLARHEVTAVLPEDAKSLKTAARLGALLNADSRLQGGIVNLAAELLQLDPPGRSGSMLNRLKSFARLAVANNAHTTGRTPEVSVHVE